MIVVLMGFLVALAWMGFLFSLAVRSCLSVAPCEVWVKSLVVSAVLRLSLCSSL